MNAQRLHRAIRILVLVSVLGILAVGLQLTSATLPAAADENPGVLPPNSNPGGMSYSEWAAEWWSWVFSVPVDDNPLLDTTGEDCAEGQSGSVWFLAGTTGGDPVERECEVPTGKMLFFPIENANYQSWPDDPYTWEPWLEQYIREDILAAAIDTWGGGLVAEIDGVTVENLDDYRVESPVFYSWVPDDNLIDLNAIECCGHYTPEWGEGDMSGPHVDDGTYLMLAPLSVGEHTIHIEGWNGNVDVTYDLTIVPGN